MIDPNALTRAVRQLAMLKFFPGDTETRAEIAILLAQICHSQERLEWLVTRALQLFSEWPGPMELRALYSECWMPADGVKAWSNLFPAAPGGGYPPHPVDTIPGYKALPLPDTRLLDAPRDEAVSQDPESVKLVDALAEKLRMPRGNHIRDATHRKLLDMGFLEPEGWK